jgi:hypothetical protein
MLCTSSSSQTASSGWQKSLGKGRNLKNWIIKKMDRDYQTRRFIKACTSIPLPAVFAWETSEGVAGAPFALMSFVEGSQPSDRWFDKSWIMEEKHLKILSGIATLMSELDEFPFEALGALEFDRDGLASGLGGYIWSAEQPYATTWPSLGSGENV